MQGDMADGGFSMAELEGLEAEGILSIHWPDTPEHEADRRAIAEELAVADAELLALEGPDALTSRRLLRQESLKAELDPERYGSMFASFCVRRGWERSDLASYLGVSTDRLAAMSLERLPRQEWQSGSWVTVGTPRGRIVERYGANAEHLAAVLTG